MDLEQRIERLERVVTKLLETMQPSHFGGPSAFVVGDQVQANQLTHLLMDMQGPIDTGESGKPPAE